MDDNFITITGLNHFYGRKPFVVGRLLKIIKEPQNEFDKDAIFAALPYIDTVGYVANSPNTVFDGTKSASRIYDSFQDYAYAVVKFVTHSSVIAEVIPKEQIETGNLQIILSETANTYQPFVPKAPNLPIEEKYDFLLNSTI